MKYIRTEDKIEKVPNDYANKLVECPNLIIADTIEELCDEFTFINRKYVREHRVYYSLESAIILCKEDDIPITEIKGAIWTDKGLIYVAKVNDKGELELL